MCQAAGVPEGPEIRRAADKVQAAIVGRPVRQIFFGLPGLSKYARAMERARVEEVQTFGKAMVTHFDHGLSVYSHNQLYGKWYTVRPDQDPATNRQLRFAVRTDHRDALLYSASTIEVLRREDVRDHPFISRLGPDPLHDDVDVTTFSKRLRDPAFSGRQVGTLLLEQSFAAGIGNYLRSEILFFAGVHPCAKPRALDGNTRRKLAQKLVEITRRAYATGGVTDEPRRVKRNKKDGQRRGEYRHAVFRRVKQPCRACGATISEADFSSRRLFWCPRCQPAV